MPKFDFLTPPGGAPRPQPKADGTPIFDFLQNPNIPKETPSFPKATTPPVKATPAPVIPAVPSYTPKMTEPTMPEPVVSTRPKLLSKIFGVAGKTLSNSIFGANPLLGGIIKGKIDEKFNPEEAKKNKVYQVYSTAQKYIDDKVMQPIFKATSGTAVGQGVAEGTRGSRLIAPILAAYKYVEGGAPTYMDAYEQTLKEIDKDMGDPGKSFAGKALVGIADSAPQTLVGVLLNLVPVVGKGASSTYFANVSAAEQLRSKGTVSAGNVGIDVIGDRLLGGTLESLFKKSAKDLVTTGFLATAKKVGQGAFVEGVTEPSQTLLKYANDYKNAKSDAERDQIIEEAKVYVTDGGLLLEAIIGGAVGGGTLAGGIAYQKISPKNDQEFTKEQQEYREAFREDVKQQLAQEGGNTAAVAENISEQTGIPLEASQALVDAVVAEETIPTSSRVNLVEQARKEAMATVSPKESKVPKSPLPEPESASTAKKPEIGSSLADEARKYTSVEEFLKSKGEPLLHGTTQDFKEFDLNKAGTRNSADAGFAGRGIYLTNSKEVAETFSKGEDIFKSETKTGNGRIIESYIDIPKERILEVKDFEELKDVLYLPKSSKRPSNVKLTDFIKEQAPKISQKAQEMGYEAIKIDGGGLDKYGKKVYEIVIFDPKNIKTKSQLTDIYTKAKGEGKIDTPLPKRTFDQTIEDFQSGKIKKNEFRTELKKQYPDKDQVLVEEVADQLSGVQENGGSVKDALAKNTILNESKESKSTPKGREDALKKPVESKGDEKKSRLFDRLVKRLEAEQKILAEDNPNYNVVNMRNQAERAADFIEEFPDRAKRIALGQELPPEGMLYNTIATALEEKLLDDGKINEWREVATAQSYRNTRYGQEISALRGVVDPNNPAYWLNQLIKAKIEANEPRNPFKVLYENITQNKKRSPDNVEKQTKVVKERVSASQLKITEAEELLNSLIC